MVMAGSPATEMAVSDGLAVQLTFHNAAERTADTSHTCEGAQLTTAPLPSYTVTSCAAVDDKHATMCTTTVMTNSLSCL